MKGFLYSCTLCVSDRTGLTYLVPFLFALDIATNITLPAFYVFKSSKLTLSNNTLETTESSDIIGVDVVKKCTELCIK